MYLCTWICKYSRADMLIVNNYLSKHCVNSIGIMLLCHFANSMFVRKVYFRIYNMYVYTSGYSVVKVDPPHKQDKAFTYALQLCRKFGKPINYTHNLCSNNNNNAKYATTIHSGSEETNNYFSAPRQLTVNQNMSRELLERAL